MQNKVLIVGASGLVGTAAAISFARAGWPVVAASRRRPELLNDANIEFVPMDLQDKEACAVACRKLQGITHVVYTAVYELPGLVDGWSDPDQIRTNGQMLENLLVALAQSNQIQHVTLLQGTKAYGAMVGPMRVPARESQPRVEHPNFYWVQEDFLRDHAKHHDYTFTILRPQMIVGPNHGVVMNLPPVVGVYAALRQAEGLPLAFPGGVDRAMEAVDARLVGDACLWAAINESAAGETYNLTNGEVFSWRDMWPAIARALDVPLGEDEPLSIAEYLMQRQDLWQSIVARHDLAPNTLEQIVGESHHYADLCFAFGANDAPPPIFVSTVKIHQAGFNQTYNSEESFCYWLRDLRSRRIIP
jgi:nucleoside-diphosphate-sugar epimerase